AVPSSTLALKNSGAVQVSVPAAPVVIPPTPPTPPAPTPPATTTTTIGSGSDALVLKISEDAYNGHAQYTIKVDGVQVGGVLTASASHALGQSDTVTVKGNWGSAAHKVEVSFLNDAWGGTSSTDRNLYVDSITYGGKAVPSSTVMIGKPETVAFTTPAAAVVPPLGGTSTTIGNGSDALVLKISEDAYNG
ncbi:carbohydrate-binding domain-containing protein, partial [Muricoccus vinaceus]